MCNTRLALPRFLIYCILCIGPTTGQGPLHEPFLHEELGFMPMDYIVEYNIGRNYLPSRAGVT